MTCFTIRTMSLSEHDKHELQLNPSTIPSPRFQFAYRFRLPQGYTVMYAVPTLKRFHSIDSSPGVHSCCHPTNYCLSLPTALGTWLCIMRVLPLSMEQCPEGAEKC